MPKHSVTVIILIFIVIKSAYGTTCAPGQYLPADNNYCTICPANNYCQGDNTVTKCPDQTYSYPGTTNVAFCYLYPEQHQTLHIGDIAITMVSHLASRPALATQSTSGDIFYAMLSKDKCSNIRVMYNDTIMSVCSGTPHTQIDYIESTGTQYLDTGYTLEHDADAEILMTATGLQPDTIAWTGANAYLQLRLQNGWSIEQTGAVIPYGTKDDIRITYKDKTTNLYINQTAVQSKDWSALIRQNVKITIFKLGNYNNNGTFDTPAAKMKLYSYKLILNGTTVRDLIPVLDNYGIPCMFDKISGQYLYNAVPGRFLYH